MTVSTFGAPLVVPVSFDESKATATLNDGRILTLRSPDSYGLRVYTPTGELLQTISVNANNQGIATMQVAALADGGFVVSGATGVNIAFRIYNADLTERTSGPVVIAQPGFFNGGNNYGHSLEALPNGGFVVAWNSIQDTVTGGVGFLTGSPTTIINGGSSSGIDVRGSIYNASGQLTSASSFLITQGNIAFNAAPNYTINSRFGDQYLYDLDVMSDSSVVATFYGQRFGIPSGGNALFTNSTPYFYDTFRVINGTTGAAIVGETPYNATAAIGQEVSSNYHGQSQTVVLANGTIAGIYNIDLQVVSPDRYQSKLQLFNAGGTAIGAEIDLGLNFGHSNFPGQVRAVATDTGGFALAYMAPPSPADVGNSLTYNVYVREYRIDGSIVNTVQLTTASGYERIESFERGPDGTYIVTSWNSAVSPNTSINNILAVTGVNDTVQNGTTVAETLTATGTGKNWLSSGGGADVINGGSGTNYLYGGSGDSTFNGGSGVNIMRGGSGNERMTGGVSNDSLLGDAGNDFLTGGAGNDALTGGAGFDYANYLDATSGVTVSLAITTAQVVGGGLGSDTLTSIEGLYGSNLGDTLTGDGAAVNAIYAWGGADSIVGNAGFDYVEAGEGDDTIEGGAGDDYLLGGNGLDTVTFAAAGVSVYVDMSGASAFANSTTTGFDVLSSVERIIGSGFADYLFGSAGADTLIGGNGIDIIYGFGLGDSLDGGGDTDYLVGGAGADTITTGAGQDYIYFQGQTEGKDTITDWRVSGFDILCIDEPAFGAGLTVNQYLSDAGNANRFVAGTVATAAIGQFLWNSATSTLSWDADGTGGGVAVQLVTLTGITNLSASDILVL